ncbi:MAG: response regulator [Alphaproteobacteria bacterium]
MNRPISGLIGRLALLIVILVCVAGLVLLTLRASRAPSPAAPPSPRPVALDMVTSLAEAQFGNALEGAYRLLQGARGEPIEGLRSTAPAIAGIARADATGKLVAANDPALLDRLDLDADYLRGHAEAPEQVFVSLPLANGRYLAVSQADGDGVLLAVLDLTTMREGLDALAGDRPLTLALRHQGYGLIALAGDDGLADILATSLLKPVAAQEDASVDGIGLRYRRLGPGPLELLTAGRLPAAVAATAAPTAPATSSRLLYYLAAAIALLLAGYAVAVERRLLRRPALAAATGAVPVPRTVNPSTAVQRLAGGVAHDFDQVMQAVVGFADMALWKLARSQSPREELSQILNAGHRGGVLTRQLDAFAETDPPAVPPIDLAEVAGEVADRLIRGLGTTIEVERWFDPGPMPVTTTPAEVEQVLTGLAAYALSALRDRGRLRVSLQPVTLSGGLRADSGDLDAGKYARLEVSDDGAALDPASVARLFDPFREPDDDPLPGALDLAVAVALLRRRGGGLAVTSDGDGTTLTAFWPISRVPLAEPRDSDLPQAAGETVLVVNDDPALVRLAEAILRRLGLQPVASFGAEEALALFRADPGHYQIVLADQLMPDMTGAEMAREIAALRPDLPVILTTGYRGLALAEPEPPVGVTEILDLPLTTHTLGPAIARCLTKARIKQDIAPAAD